METPWQRANKLRVNAAPRKQKNCVDAARRGDANKVQELLAWGVDVNFSKEGYEGRNAFDRAAFEGHLV